MHCTATAFRAGNTVILAATINFIVSHGRAGRFSDFEE